MQRKLLLAAAPLLLIFLIPYVDGADQTVDEILESISYLEGYMEQMEEVMKLNAIAVERLENSTSSEFEWEITSWSETDESGEKYLNFKVENVWPQQRVFMNYVYEDGTYGSTYSFTVQDNWTATDRIKVEHYDGDCYQFNMSLSVQPFYTEYEHCN